MIPPPDWFFFTTHHSRGVCRFALYIFKSTFVYSKRHCDIFVHFQNFAAPPRRRALRSHWIHNQWRTIVMKYAQWLRALIPSARVRIHRLTVKVSIELLLSNFPNELLFVPVRTFSRFQKFDRTFPKRACFPGAPGAHRCAHRPADRVSTLRMTSLATGRTRDTAGALTAPEQNCTVETQYNVF